MRKWNSPVVGTESSTSIDLIDKDPCSMMFDSIESTLDWHVTAVAVPVAPDHRHDTRASDDYFLCPMFPTIHSAYRKYFDPKQSMMVLVSPIIAARLVTFQ